jgi:hypothetical protein
MVLVALNDAFELYWQRGESMRSFAEETWAAYFDVVISAIRIAGSDEGLLSFIFNELPGGLEDRYKAPMFACLAAALQQSGDLSTAQQAFSEALRSAGWTNQAAVVRVCTRCVGLLGAREGGKLLERLAESLFDEQKTLPEIDPAKAGLAEK